ncbi:winged helix DNA-binding protein [Pelagibius litoralis]|uniref:Winged helix DNA-binding protein n=1 Tax=Pelagibius litoralis TaxID=374515 RepID=A0A967C8R3_9PROT|nr:winged helix DNA-binding protein [Pelagibius litoralis]NIA68602.1 winged helix DNA-binding protein [Pelagibius litoralis]
MSGDGTAKEKPTKTPKRRNIVSSAHLVSERAEELSAFEYGLYIASNAFERWITRCMAAAGLPELSSLDVMVVHTVNHRARDKRLSDICFVLNIEDSHTVNYALKKLTRLGLVAGDKRGKEIFYATTKEGAEVCVKYREVREACLVNSFAAFSGSQEGDLNDQIGQAADLLRALSGLYDQAARSATSL